MTKEIDSCIGLPLESIGSKWFILHLLIMGYILLAQNIYRVKINCKLYKTKYFWPMLFLKTDQVTFVHIHLGANYMELLY